MSEQLTQCSECGWTSTGLLNIGEMEAPRWICHGCTKREVEERDELKRWHATAAAGYAQVFAEKNKLESRLAEAHKDRNLYLELSVHRDNDWQRAQKRIAELEGLNADLLRRLDSVLRLVDVGEGKETK